MLTINADKLVVRLNTKAYEGTLKAHYGANKDGVLTFDLGGQPGQTTAESIMLLAAHGAKQLIQDSLARKEVINLQTAIAAVDRQIKRIKENTLAVRANAALDEDSEESIEFVILLDIAKTKESLGGTNPIKVRAIAAGAVEPVKGEKDKTVGAKWRAAYNKAANEMLADEKILAMVQHEIERRAAHSAMFDV